MLHFLQLSRKVWRVSPPQLTTNSTSLLKLVVCDVADELESEYIGLELYSPSYFVIFAALQHFEAS